MIAALGKPNRVIGNSNKLLWNIPEDLAHFKKLTIGQTIIMGRKTYESIGRPLPSRTNIIISRNENYTIPGAIVTNSLDLALDKAIKQQCEIFIIGGAQIYQAALPLADKLYLTIIDGSFQGDVYFPDYSTFTKVIHQEESSSAGYSYTFLELEK